MAERIIEIRSLCIEPEYVIDYSDYEHRIRLIEERGREIELRYNHNHDEKGRFCSGVGGGRAPVRNDIDNLVENDIIESDTFHCYGDYLRDKMGSAKDSNPEEFEEIKNDVESQGGKLILLKNNTKMVCNVSKGEPGVIEVDENISLAGLKHEYRHFLDDMENGNPGLAYYLFDRDAFFNYERRGYEEELKIARKFGYHEAEKKILGEIEKRRKEIYGE